MYRFFKSRIKESLEVGLNVRKAFACQQNASVKQQQNDVKENGHQSVIKTQEIKFNSSQKRAHDEFKKKYNCRHPNSCGNVLQAITWVCYIFVTLKL